MVLCSPASAKDIFRDPVEIRSAEDESIRTFEGLMKLGADFTYDHENHFYSVETDRLQGAYLLLDEASVTGTANLVMAAVLAKGTTTIYNAACEPYLQQLCSMLNRMGGNISGIGSNRLTIEGVERLSWYKPPHSARYGRNWELDWIGSTDEK